MTLFADGSLSFTGPPAFDDSALLRAAPLTTPVARGAVVFRKDEEGFVVDELPAYAPCGEGEHLYLWIEKRGLSTTAVMRTLQRLLKLHERDIGYAGRKDERGVTRQWISVPARSVPDLAAFMEPRGLSPGWRVLEAKKHKNKLRLGHLYGNRFTVHLDGDVDVTALSERARAIEDSGVPNLFGAQRFGIDGSTLAQAMQFLARERMARSRRDELFVSAVQSSLFNAWLSDRVDDSSWSTALDGDVLEKTLTGAPFVCTSPSDDAPRIASGEICVSGPMLGRRMRSAEREALTRESRSWSKAGLDLAGLLAHPAFSEGTRRPACLRASALHIAPRAAPLDAVRAGVTLAFSLPKGAYASILLRALLGDALVDAAFVDGPITGPSDTAPQPAPTT